ncbi:MAG: hypothetical protein K2W82_13050 [Candidatus Obscuribacterales bacterium]|nr:hypothetical protein [Candidatus Obscuribacterales bacterium]
MNHRQQRGGTLALIAASTVVLVIIGAVIYMIINIFGGFRELQNATDSGNLNLARLAIKRPSIALVSTDPTGVDQGLARLADADVGGEINLLVYNRLIGQALLTAMNAQAEADSQGNIPTSIQANVRQLFNRLQNSPNNIGSQLYQVLQNGIAGNLSRNNANYDLRTQFATLSTVNSARMNNGGNVQQQQGGNNYRIGYYLAPNASTNIQLDGPNGLMTESNRPRNLDTGRYVPLPANAATANAAPDGRRYMRGYEPITFTGLPGMSLVGVPVHPGEQPHHISMRDFRATANALGTGLPAGVNIPPNAFYSKARVNVNLQGHAQVSETESVAVVGVMGQSYSPSFQSGYLIIDNGTPGAANGFAPMGSSVLANELGTGILVSGSNPNAVFTTNDMAMNAWSAYDHSGPPPPVKPADAPDTNGLFNSQGDPATWQEAWSNIPKNSIASICDDQNTSSSPCQQLIDPQGGRTQGAFDLAYHRNNNLGGSGSQSNSLIAAEIGKCRVWQAYYVPPFSACVNNVCASYFNGIPSTGLRLFPQGSVPWLGQPVYWCRSGAGFAQIPGNGYSQNQQCQVTSDGTLRQLIDQSFNTGAYTYVRGNGAAQAMGAGTAQQDRPTAKLTEFLLNRIKQISPEAGTAEVNQVLDTTIRLGRRYFVYLNNSGQIVCNEAPPPSHDNNVRPDGVLRRYIRSYDADELITNTQHDNCIHDHHFMSGNSAGRVWGHNTIAVTPSSGAVRGLLGVVQLQNDLGCYRNPPFSGVAAATAPTGDFSLCNRD